VEKILLLVDDEPAILKSLQRIFRRTDYHVLTADNGNLALEIIAREPVAVLVSDFNMPGLDGALLLSKARQLRPEMSRVILSGNSDQDSVIRSINDGGALKFLTKPWDGDELKKEVDAAYDIWAEKRFSLDIDGLLNQKSFYGEIHQRLKDPDSGRYALINLRIRDFESLLQVVELQQATDLMKQYWLARELTAEADNIFGLMDDGKFCVLLPIDDVQMDEQLIIKTLVSSLEGEFEYGDNTFQISFDVGYALFDGSQSPEALLRNALTALNRVVPGSGEQCIAFDETMQASTRRRLEIAEHLASALTNNELHLLYQPKIKTSSQTLHGAEALLRWNNPTLGFVSPLDFIPVAEENDLISEIGHWVMETASYQWNDWFKGQKTDVRISVNVSPRQLWDRQFVEQVSQVLVSTKIDPSVLELEITESVMMQDIETAISVLHEIKSLGVKTSIDDFGTGYSSLNYLHRLPLDVLKIDRSFVLPLEERKESQSLVKNLIVLGQDLNMEIVAEGVENEAQLDLLLNMGCDVIQGYYYSPPITTDEFTALMKTYPVLSTPDIGGEDMPMRKAS